MKISKPVLATALLLAGVSSVQADAFGTLSGRSANPANSTQLSVEGSFTTGSDYQNIGARINYDLSPSLTVYGDFGSSEIEFEGISADADGTVFGAGVFYYLPDMSESVAFFNDKDVAVQANYHTGTLDLRGFDLDTTSLGVALLVSPKTAFNPDNGMNWYANVGFVRVSSELGGLSDDESDIQFGGGIFMPAGQGTFYAGADYIDGAIIGAGFRYGIQ